MPYIIKKLPKSQIEILFELPFSELEKFRKEAVSELGKKLKIEGFRPGHTPEKIIEQKIGKMAILEEAAEEAIKENYQKAVLESNLTPIAQPQVEILPARNASPARNAVSTAGWHSDAGGKLALGDDLRFKIRVFVLPQIQLPDYKKIVADVKRKEISVSEKDIKDSLAWLQKSRAKFSLKNAPSQKGDFAEIEYSSPDLEGGKKYQDSFILGDGHFLPGFEENLENLKDGEEKEFSIKFPENYSQKELAEKDVIFKIKMKSVQKAELPEISDDFAKGLGKFENLEALKKNIKEGINLEKEREESQRIRQEILDKISKASACEIPEALVESEKKRMSDLSQEQAEKRVKNSLVLHELSEKENITVSEEEIKEEMNRFLEQYPLPAVATALQAGDVKTAENQLDSERLKEYIKDAICNEKTFKLLESLIQK